MAAPQKGQIVIYGEWTGSAYVEYEAYVRVVATPGSETSDVSLSYSDGSGAASQANNIANIETISSNVDYWRAETQPLLGASQPLATGERPLQGQIVWLLIYDSTEAEYFNFLGFVRAIQGPPTDLEPSINTSYFDTRSSVDASVNANNVDSVEDVTGTDDYWALV